MSINTNEQKNLLIDDMHFFIPNEEQKTLITRFSSHKFKEGFYKRFIISLITAFVFFTVEFIARTYTNRHAVSHFFHYPGAETIPGMIIFVVFVFLLFNLLSFIYMRIKIQMNDITARYECMQGIVTEKYDGRHLSQSSGEASRNYILFSNEEGHCTTALSVNNLQTFQSIQAGDEILVIKYKSLGTTDYSFIPLTEKIKA